MKNTIIASRYAEALLAAATDQNEAEAILEQVKWYQENAATSTAPILENPMIPKEKKEALITKLFTGKGGKLIFHLIRLLLRKGRVAYWGEICRLYPKQYDVKRGIVNGTLSLAYPLPDDLINQLKGKIESKIGHKVALTIVDTPEILGGFIFTTGTERLDASIKGQLASLVSRLKTVSVG
jgi:F-type H+-transporting ATPase subunit delta